MHVGYSRGELVGRKKERTASSAAGNETADITTAGTTISLGY